MLIALFMPLRSVTPPPQPLLLHLEGIVDDKQRAAQEVEENKAQPKEVAPPVELPSPAPQPEAEKPQPAPPPPPPPEVQPEAVLPDAPPEKPAVPPRKSSPIAPQSQPKPGLRLDVTGARERADARRLTEEELKRALLQEYVRQLSQRIEANLLYPPEARKAGLAGTAKVGFSILTDGQIDGASLRIVTSSGQALLDQSALDTVRASVPLPPPPQPISLTIEIVFSQKSDQP